MTGGPLERSSPHGGVRLTAARRSALARFYCASKCLTADGGFQRALYSGEDRPVPDSPVSKPSPAGGSHLPIAPTPQAVVIDTSLWGRGTLDIGRLQSHAERLAKSGIEVWVPTQVLLEWSSHAVNDAKEAAPIWKRLYRAGLVAEKFPLLADVDSMVAALTAKLEAIPNIKVLPMTKEAAVQGLKDQILGTGPGSSRSGVKTGGVDSSWVRDALSAAGNDPAQVLFVTGNAKDVHATAKAMGIAPLHVRTEQNMYSALFGAVMAPTQLVKLVTGEMDILTAVVDTEDWHSFPEESGVPLQQISLTPDLFDPPYSFEVTDVTLAAGASVVAIVAVEVVSESDDEPPTNEPEPSNDATPTTVTVEFKALLLGNLDVNGYQLDQDGQVVTQSTNIYGALVVAPFIADVEDLHVEVGAAGNAVADTSEPRFDEPHEALEWVIAELTNLHGVTVVDDDITNDEFVFTGVGDLTVIATMSGDAYSDWTLEFEVDDETVVVSCRYDPSARVWAGKDSFDMWPPYVLSQSAGDDSFAGEPYSAMSLVWRYLNGVLGP